MATKRKTAKTSKQAGKKKATKKKMGKAGANVIRSPQKR